MNPISKTLATVSAAVTTALTASPALACGNTTYVHPSLGGNPTAYGGTWNNHGLVVAARNRSLRGQTIRLCADHNNRCVTVRVTDYSPNSEFDLSRAAFAQLADLSTGRICTRIHR